jgi:calcium permeable stress-gated cation channel
MYGKWLEADPKDIVWANLDHDVAEMRSRFAISWTATIGLVIIWAFPVAFVGTLSNITSLCGKFS